MTTATDKPFTQPASFAFSDENMKKAKEIIAKYPKERKESACMPLLTLAQHQHEGWLPQAAMEYVADMLEMPSIRVYEVATFYTMYNLRPVGKYHVQVCTNIACLIRGSDQIMRTCHNVLGINKGETTKDNLFTLHEVECLGACVNAPMMQINDDFYEDLDAGSTEKILRALADGECPQAGSQIGRKGAEPTGGLTSLKNGESKNEKPHLGKGHV